MTYEPARADVVRLTCIIVGIVALTVFMVHVAETPEPERRQPVPGQYGPTR